MRVPTARPLKAGIIGGDVIALGLSNDITTSTIGGNIVVSTVGVAEATTLGGSVTVTIGATDPERDLSFTALGGNVTVTVPANINAVVELNASAGAVSSDFALMPTGNTLLTGTLGTGGPRIRLSSRSGNVQLLSQP